MERGRFAGSRRGARGRRPPRLPGVSCPVSASPRGPLEQPGLLGVLRPWGVGSPLLGGPTGGPGGPVLWGRTLDRLHRRLPGPLQKPPLRPWGLLRCRLPGVGGAVRTGHATGISVPSPGGCWRLPPCLQLGRRRAARATPGVPASPRLCSTCPHVEGISLAPWPPVPGGAAPTCGWRPSAPGRRVGWPAERCAAPARGPGPTR